MVEGVIFLIIFYSFIKSGALYGVGKARQVVNCSMIVLCESRSSGILFGVLTYSLSAVWSIRGSSYVY